MHHKIYYPGLNELRALAALCVIPGHIEQIKGIFNIHANYWFPIPGKLGVVLFFVLSGFLITMLLLSEKNKRGQINLRNFYMRRMLRIWPLYFLVVIASILVFNNLQFLQLPTMSLAMYDNLTLTSILLLLLVLPNYIGFVIPYASHTWSIGVEEQFYLVQPLVIKWVKKTVLLILFLCSIIFLKEILTFCNYYLHSAIIGKVAAQADYFGCIAIGSLGALVHSSNSKYFNALLTHKIIQAVSIFAFIYFLWVINVNHSERTIDFRLHAIVFMIVVVNSATNEKSFLRINNRILDRIGKVSYGVYMYHPISIGLAIAIATQSSVLLDNYALLNATIYMLALIFTLGISFASYQYFEGYFLRRKGRWNS